MVEKGPVTEFPLGDFQQLELLFVGNGSRTIRHSAKRRAIFKEPRGRGLFYTRSRVGAPGESLISKAPPPPPHTPTHPTPHARLVAALDAAT